MKTPALSDQGPTLVTLCMLSRFSRVQLFVTLWTVTHSLLCPWDSPGKNTGLGGHSLLQGIFLTQGLNPSLPLSFNLNYFPKGPISKHSHTENQDLNILIEKEGGTQFSPKQIPKASSDNAGTPGKSIHSCPRGGKSLGIMEFKKNKKHAFIYQIHTKFPPLRCSVLCTRCRGRNV